MEILIFSFLSEREARILSNYLKEVLQDSNEYSGTSIYRKSEILGKYACFDVFAVIENERNQDLELLKDSFLSYWNGYSTSALVSHLSMTGLYNGEA